MTPVEINKALLEELKKAHRIIEHAEAVIPVGSREVWFGRNWASALVENAGTGRDERAAVIAAAEEIS